MEPGENVLVNVDVLMTHDVCGPGTIGIFKEYFGQNARVWDSDKVVIIPDHYIFTAKHRCHRNVQILRDFVKEQGIRYYYDPDFIKGEGMSSPYTDPTKTSYKGVCHKALPEEGHVRPGEILLGADSHTGTAWCLRSICFRSGHLIRIPDDALAPGRSPLISMVGHERLMVTKISDNPFVPMTKARLLASNLDLHVNF